MRLKLTLLLAVLTILTLTSLVAPPPAEACMGGCRFVCDRSGFCEFVCGGGGGVLTTPNGVISAGISTVTRTGANSARIEVDGYFTAEMLVTYECVVAFPKVDGVDRIDRLSLIDHSTRRPMGNYDWTANDNSVADFSSMAVDNGVAPSAEWQGFFATVWNGSVGGIRHSFAFDVTLRPGVTLEALVEALRSQGVVAHGSGRPDGSLDFAGHYHLRRLGDGLILVNDRDARTDGRPPRRR